MKPWHNSSSQPTGNRMNSWHPQIMQPSSHTSSGYPCYLANQNTNAPERHMGSSSCPPIRQNTNFYWQDQRRVSMPTLPGIQSHMHHQQNFSMTMTHQQRHYQQPPEFCQAGPGYHQGRNGNECRNYHYSSQPPTHQFSVQTPYQHHQQQYPMGPPNMMMPYQPQYQHQHQHLHAPTNMYPLAIGSPSFNCQTGNQPNHPPMHPSMMVPNYVNACAETYCQRRAPQSSYMGGTTGEQNFRHSLTANQGKNMVKSPSAKFQNVRNFGGLRQSKVMVLDNVGDLASKKDLFAVKKNMKTGREARRSWSSVVGGTPKEESAKLGTSCESDADTDSGSFVNSVKSSGRTSRADATSGVVRKILARPTVSGNVKEVCSEEEKLAKDGSVVGDFGKKGFLKTGSFFADDVSDEKKCSGLIFNFAHKENKPAEKTKLSVIGTRESPFVQPSCQQSLGVIYERESEKEYGNVGIDSETGSEKSASELGKIRVMSILEKVAEGLKGHDDPLNYRSIETTKENARVSRAVSREPRLKKIRNKWNIADKFGGRKSRTSSRRNSQRRASSNDSPKVSPMPLIRSQSQSSLHKKEVTVEKWTTYNTLSTIERRASTEKGYEYDINIDDMVTNICHSSTPSFTSSEDCQATQEKGDKEIVESENENFQIKAFEDDEYYSTLNDFSEEACGGCLAKEDVTSSCDGEDEGVESMRVAFTSLSASISAIKDRLEEMGSEPHKLIQETEASFLKFQKSYLKAKTAFQEDKFKYPTDIHYDELSAKADSFKIGPALHSDYEIIIDYKICARPKTKTHPHKEDCTLRYNSLRKFKEMPCNYESNFKIDERISYGHNPLLNYNYYGQLNIDSTSSRFESRTHFGVTYGSHHYQNSKEKIFSTFHMPQQSNNFQFFPELQFSYQHPHFSDKQDKVEDVDPNTIDFNTNEMKEDTISASSSESTIRPKVEESECKQLPKDKTSRSTEVNQLNASNDDECGPWEYLRPGLYPESPQFLPEFLNDRKEDAKDTTPMSGPSEMSEQPCHKDNEPCIKKLDPSDRGSYLQPGAKQKSLVDMMKHSGGIDKSVPFSIKQLETRTLEVSQNKDKSSEKCENWLADNVKPSSEPKRIPSLFEVKISGVFNTRPKSERQKQSTSSYGSGDAPYHQRRNVSANRNGSRPGGKKLAKRHTPVSKGSARRKEEIDSKEVVQGQAPGQQWQAIAPGMYRNVNLEREVGGVDSEKSTGNLGTVDEAEIDQGKFLNRPRENPLPLSKILASARKNMDEG